MKSIPIKPALERLVLGLLVLAFAAPAAMAEQITVTDLAGRTVSVQLPAKRIVLAEARQLVSLSLIDRDVARRIVGTAGTRLFDPEARKAYEANFAEFAAAPKLDDEASNLSAEKTIEAEPDLVILSGNIGRDPRSQALAETLTAAGIPAIFIDFRADPYENTVPSVELLGKVLGKEAEARAFLDFYLEHRSRIVERVAKISDRPSVFMEMQANSREQCCMSPSRANLGRFIVEAGGINIGEAVVPGAFGPLSPEYLLAQDPDIYIGTGGRHLASSGGIVAGPGISEEEALAALKTVVARPIISELSAVHKGDAHSLWHNFHNSPLNIVALEVLAKWFHPNVFADVDPHATVDEINRRFLPVPFEGAAWISLAKD
ncbi:MULTISPECIES: ABC transporter substrate-binding protein [unclassified Mesorhizobium]|uniref:ABC transporter substrate-binding protein n=1 Tax=unclassified Mesorhizobium TaxID=325217 RepID=UPI0030145C40